MGLEKNIEREELDWGKLIRRVGVFSAKFGIKFIRDDIINQFNIESEKIQDYMVKNKTGYKTAREKLIANGGIFKYFKIRDESVIYNPFISWDFANSIFIRTPGTKEPGEILVQETARIFNENKAMTIILPNVIFESGDKEGYLFLNELNDMIDSRYQAVAIGTNSEGEAFVHIRYGI